MNKSRRQLQIGEKIKRIIGSFILSGDLVGLSPFITITRADASPDLRNITIIISAFDDGLIDDALQLLATPIANLSIKAHLAKAAGLRSVPQLIFRKDQSIANQKQMDTILTSNKINGEIS